MAFHKSTSSSEKKFEYEVKEDLGVISSNKGYETKLTYMSWNGGEPKYDIRQWKDGEPKKGVARFTGEEMEKILEILQKASK